MSSESFLESELIVQDEPLKPVSRFLMVVHSVSLLFFREQNDSIRYDFDGRISSSCPLMKNEHRSATQRREMSLFHISMAGIADHGERWFSGWKKNEHVKKNGDGWGQINSRRSRDGGGLIRFPTFWWGLARHYRLNRTVIKKESPAENEKRSFDGWCNRRGPLSP